MAAFATMAAAEVRAYAKVKDHTWVDAHAARTVAGVICVRVQRYLTTATQTEPTQGAWVEITDNATT